MEQHRTRPPQYRKPGGTPPLPPQARRPPAPARRPSPSSAGAVRRLPNPRLTGLGAGLFCGALMFLVGCLDDALFDASPTVYGVLFLPVCAVTALWLRRGDVLTAPVVVPLAFALGLLPVADGGGGLAERLMGLFTALATQAGWLYGGTLVAGVVATARRVHVASRRPARGRPPG
ncbi:DUF6542 domain-containing protein [Streptomyces sp. NPDC005574]|uniref:DUF6542 domain-containing protein n=1 Tax=Streptomyces sp. NPDC005574 TaxID=3156891 RepID=UPI0033B32F49